jgi:Protein of unknown function (DUF1638)
MRIKAISCDVLYRELCHAASRSPHQVDVQFLSKGLHDEGCRPMRLRLQAEIDKTDASKYDAIVLGYALCGNGTVGLTARNIPVVIPRAHDCITLLMGSRQAFEDYFDKHPGVYYRSTGWLERGKDVTQLKSDLIRQRTGAGYELEDLVSRYGEENGRYLYDQFNSYKNSYTQLTYIETGLETTGKFEREAQKEAAERGWKFEKVQGSTRIFEAMVSGNWSEDEFLVVPPCHRVKESFDGKLIDIEKVK